MKTYFDVAFSASCCATATPAGACCTRYNVDADQPPALAATVADLGERMLVQTWRAVRSGIALVVAAQGSTHFVDGGQTS